MSDPRASGCGPAPRPSRRSALALWLIAAAGLLLSTFPAALLQTLLKLSQPVYLLIANLCYYLPFVALPVFCVLCRRPGRFRACRPNPISPFNTVSIVLLALLGVFFVNGLTALWSIPLEALGFNVHASPGLSVPSDPRGLVICVLYVAVLPGVCEEFLFRGAMLPAFEAGGTRRAVWATSLLFALLHGSLAGLPAQFLLGVVMAALVIWCDSVYAGLIYHTVHNAASVILQFLQQGAPAADAEPTRMLEAIGGGPGVLMLSMELLLLGAMMFFTLNSFRLRARLAGVAPIARKKTPYRRSEWLLLLAGLLMAALLYAADVAAMLGILP